MTTLSDSSLMKFSFEAASLIFKLRISTIVLLILELVLLASIILIGVGNSEYLIFLLGFWLIMLLITLYGVYVVNKTNSTLHFVYMTFCVLVNGLTTILMITLFVTLIVDGVNAHKDIETTYIVGSVSFIIIGLAISLVFCFNIFLTYHIRKSLRNSIMISSPPLFYRNEN
eukprot:TRINITY_DN2453_c0_g1_i1.p1 TRINITY_DN2453_c0_g1~~TRINITY_DN2453_c0_g1_i1.p1  ORF type:complete len:171 (-),score=-4.58 TRINITY_DN2453_c0_g1_i1:9-521(-)